MSSSETDEVRYELDQHVATITLNRTEELNAFSPEMLDAWAGHIRAAAEDDAVRVLVITGAGRAFCAGGNMKARAQHDSGAEETQSARAIRRRNELRYGVQSIPRALEYLDKPYIAAVNGAAAGGGMDVACQADIRIASDRARFAMSYVRRGLIPGDGGAWLLPRIVGESRALELIWSGEAIDAEEALRIGLVSRVVPHERLLEETYAYARTLAGGAPIAMQLAKQLVRCGRTQPFPEALEAAQAAMSIAHTSDDAREGPRAFAEKRQPLFKGR